ncbi:hypothetical protein DOTSEDRAFT_22212 [Dothistroma septosporum NZE10]|uniref:F-box domain-containing protein n=1 Tax=Dothistroma septosporum (strain NZE10 / CBS 128990) TaxID=675120 RepID=N1PRU2_DOTSN|nr:hypothetical protein DOTSEDRAFT_22212 [Dothistroma septosporum NZE10]
MAHKRRNLSIDAAGPQCKKQKTSPTFTPSEKKKTPSSLLTLPAEIRNNVYEYALYEDPNIWITSDIREPPLLSVNRQIRHEALGL